MIPEVAEFAEVARRFQQWALPRGESSSAAALTGLALLVDLYRAGLRLVPAPVSGTSLCDPQVSDHEWQRVYSAASRLPIGLYSEVLDLTKVPAEKDDLGVGDVGDDVADIYRDVVVGLMLFEQGRHDDAHWCWVFGLANLWGEHATSAIRALHARLMAEGAFSL